MADPNNNFSGSNRDYGDREPGSSPDAHDLIRSRQQTNKQGASRIEFLESRVEELMQQVCDLQGKLDSLQFAGTATCNGDGTITLEGQIS